VLYDPGRAVWIAVYGRDTLLAAYTPAELAGQITRTVLRMHRLDAADSPGSGCAGCRLG
jgi:hypothetical protein